jgi:tRNA-specific 2-thiouridylase
VARVIVALSGGVDSAVSAALLQDAGHAVEALFMANWAEDEDGYCTAAADFQDARRVCEELAIPLHRASFAREYRERVFAPFLAELEAGRTPNPDVLCNSEVKFGVALDYARRLGADRFATGHYVRTGAGGRLLRGTDGEKDQSYFLHALGSAQLESCDFPVGGLRKAEVRRMARDRGLPVAAKKDSTGICFVGERPFGDFVGRWLPERPGPIETPDGRIVGRHRGLARYTLGQRSGLGIGGLAGAAGAPWFVAAKDLARNVLLVVQGPDHPALRCTGVSAVSPRWVAGRAPAAALRCTAKLRYRQADAACRVALANGGVEVSFDSPVSGAAPGQYVVFYDGEECLGGAAIMAVHPLEDACRTASRPAETSRPGDAPTPTSRSTPSASRMSDASPTR